METWTPVEDNLLILMYQYMPPGSTYSVLSRLIRRKRQKCYDRLQLLLRDGIVASRSARRSVGRRRLSKFENALVGSDSGLYPPWTEDDNVWNAIAAGGSIGLNSLKICYYLKIFPPLKRRGLWSSQRNDKMTSLRRTIVRNIVRTSANSWEQVDWEQLGFSCNNIGAIAVYVIFRQLVEEHVPEKDWNDIMAISTILKKRILVNSRQKEFPPLNSGASQCEKKLDTLTE